MNKSLGFTVVEVNSGVILSDNQPRYLTVCKRENYFGIIQTKPGTFGESQSIL
jgi:hypothetical protein